MIWIWLLLFAIVLVHVILFSWWAYWTVRRRKFWQTPAGVEYNRLRREEMSNEKQGKADSEEVVYMLKKYYDHLIVCESNLTNTLGVCAEQRKTIDGLEIKSSRMLDKLREQEAIIESGRTQDKKRDKVIQDLRDELSKLKQLENINTSVAARLVEENKILCEKVKMRDQRLDDITKNFTVTINLREAEISQLRKHISAMIVGASLPKDIASKPSYTVSQNQSCDGLMWNKDHPKKFYISPTGGQKDIAGKPRFDLVPIEFIEGAALAFKFGAKKYSAHNWRKGIEVSILVRSLLSHVMKYNDGEDKDHESDLHHLDHACATLAMLITTAKTMPHMDNRYGKALRTPFGEFIVRQEAAGNAINTNYRESGDNSEGRV